MHPLHTPKRNKYSPLYSCHIALGGQVTTDFLAQNHIAAKFHNFNLYLPQPHGTDITFLWLRLPNCIAILLLTKGPQSQRQNVQSQTRKPEPDRVVISLAKNTTDNSKMSTKFKI